MKHLLEKLDERHYMIIPAIGDPYTNFEVLSKPFKEFKEKLIDIHIGICEKLGIDYLAEPLEIEVIGMDIKKDKSKFQKFVDFYNQTVQETFK